jgi:putative ABC transport system permease protein
MSTIGVAATHSSTPRRWPLAVTLATRELRAGGHGFAVFVACIALGVSVITGVGALGDAIKSSFEKQGAALLGGDVTLARPHVRASAEEVAWLSTQGIVSEQATVRAMARRLDGEDQALVEVKGIDGRYPLVGQVQLSDGLTPARLIAEGGVAIDPILLERLNLKIGDTVQLGRTTHKIRATVLGEPDKISDRLNVGPRVLIATPNLDGTGFIDPGSLVTWKYALAFSNRDEPLTKFRTLVTAGLPEAGFTIRDRRDPSPQVSKTLERLRQFLTLLGLTALLVGGVGVANAVETYIDRRRAVIATMKSLGATSATIFNLHLVQVLVFAALGTAIGLVIGTAVPVIAGWLLADALPIKTEITVRPLSLLLAAAYGLLVALVFTLWPLGRAEQIRPAVLFRDEVAPDTRWPPRRVMFATAIAIAVLFALAVLGADAKLLAVYYCLAVIAALAIFAGLGYGISTLARRIPRPRRPELALALGDIGAPGGLARSVVLSLGTGLSLLVAVALVDRSIVGEIEGRVPLSSPTYFILDIGKAELPEFTALVQRHAPGTEQHTAPMLRGRLIKIGDQPVEKVKAKPEHAWVLSGDRGLTYSETVPEGSTVTEGTWWPADYNGPPLVSVEAEIAKGLGLKIGDNVTVNILGRNVEARIANLRDVKWESLALNFVLVFTPNTLAGAPHKLLATLTLPKSAPLAVEASLARAIGKEYPASTSIRVKDAINQFSAIFVKIMTAVRVAGSITLAAGALVLAGALATAQRRRIKQAVILKTLGATRGRILRTHFTEYGILALCTSVIATLVGGIAAWIVVTRVMKLEFTFGFGAVLQALGVALALVGLFGGLGTWRVLSARPVPYLRST